MSQENAHTPAQPAQLVRNEECRREVRAWLAARPATAHEAKTIRRSLFQIDKADWSLDEVVAALAFLLSNGNVGEVPNPDGATRYFQITHSGTLAAERSGL
jgi:hypothetical protein